MKAANKVIVNTGILYGRMLITVGISLYSTRLILNALGATDYGIFNLVAGVIAMLSFLNNAMATSTQRFLSFHQGKKDLSMQKKIFTNSLFLHIVIGIGIVAILEAASFFLFDGFLNIPTNRLQSAKIVYHTMSLAVFFTIVTVPFTGMLIANENMLWVAFVSIMEVLLKLAIAIFLFQLSGDRLIIYASLMVLVNILSLGLQSIYCFSRYKESTIKHLLKPDLQICKELSSFTGWNLFGSLCGLGRTQGIAIILNLFFGAVVNTSYGIANQVVSQLNFFSSTLLRAINPQIMKSEGTGDRKRMLKLSMMASKFGFLLLAVIGIPCIFEMQPILTVWLKTVPENTVIFCQLILIGTLVNQLTIGLQSAIQATGKIKIYQIVVGSIILMNIPAAYLLLWMGYPAYTAILSYAIIELIACLSRIYFLQKIAGLSVKEYAFKVFYRELGPVVSVIASCFIITSCIDIPYRFLITSAVAIITFLVSLYITGLEDDEKLLIRNFFIKTKVKFLKVTTN